MEGGEARLLSGGDHCHRAATELGSRRAHLPPRGRRRREFPHRAESRTAREALRGDRRPLLHAGNIAKLSDEISYSEAGITTRETARPLGHARCLFLLLMSARGRMAPAPEVGCRMRLQLLLRSSRYITARRHVLHHSRRAGRRARIRAALHGLGADDRPGLRDSRTTPSRNALRRRAQPAMRCATRWNGRRRIPARSDAFVLDAHRPRHIR